MTTVSIRPLIRRTLKILFIIFIVGSSIAGIQSLAEGSSVAEGAIAKAEGLDYLAACKDSGTAADVRYTIDALQEFVGSTDCDRSYELLNRRSIITLKNKQLRTVEPIGSLTYTQKLELIEGDHKLPPCTATSVKPPKGLSTLKGMSALMEIRIENYNLASADFLKGLPQLMKVDLTCNKLKDIAPATSIPALQQLVVPYNQLAALPSLKALKDLVWVNASYNEITKVAPMTGMAPLERINLSHNKLTAFPETDFVGYLDVSHNKIAGGSHPGAGFLRVSHNKLADLSFVKNPGRVSELAISDNAVKDMSGLKAFTKIYALDLSRNPIAAFNASTIPSAGLDGLAANGVGLTELPDFSGFANLRKLSLAGNKLASFEQSKLPKVLHSLNISGNQLTELTLTNRAITSLSARSNKLSRITFSCPGTELETGIILDDNPLAGAPTIENCPMLSGFSARKTGLKNVRFLAAVTDLWRADLRDNPIGDLTPLRDLERIAVIRLEGTLLDKPGAKNASNCPQDARSKVLADWCSSEN